MVLSIAVGVTVRQLGIVHDAISIEQPAAESDVVGALAIGEKAIVANAMEAVRQGV